MKTPIYDFVSSYIAKDPVRFHMPGHKGRPLLGCEERDLTEISGADVLSEADGVILESENNASLLFGTAHSFYCTEGSSQCIRAMLAMVATAKEHRTRPRRILAARNAHKAMIQASALLGLEVDWLYPEEETHLCSCPITAAQLRDALEAAPLPLAVYITSPDYLGQCADIAALAEVCHAHDTLLLVDNAHGAYLRFLSPSQHPMDLGADLCCDSAHKTLPVLTGGAYLHVSKNAPSHVLTCARQSLALFCSTSPSYLILQSLDLCNKILEDAFPARLRNTVERVAKAKEQLTDMGYSVQPSEPLKLVLNTAAYGYDGDTVATHLRSFGIEPEYADPTQVVLMPSTETVAEDWERVCNALRSLPKRTALPPPRVQIPRGDRGCSIRDAILHASEILPIEDAVGRICARPTVSCPPAIPLVISGERITEAHVALFKTYGQRRIAVLCTDEKEEVL